MGSNSLKIPLEKKPMDTQIRHAEQLCVAILQKWDLQINCIAWGSRIYGIRALYVRKRCRHDGAELGAECARTTGKWVNANYWLSWQPDGEQNTQWGTPLLQHYVIRQNVDASKNKTSTTIKWLRANSHRLFTKHWRSDILIYSFYHLSCA